MATKIFTAPFIQDYKTRCTVLTNTNETDIFVAGTAGSKVQSIELMSMGVTIPGRLTISVNDGTITTPIRDVIITGVTPSNTVNAWQWSIELGDFPLQEGCKLIAQMTTWNSNMGVTVLAGDYREV